MRRKPAFFWVLFLTLWLVSCATTPQQDIDTTQAAIQAARDAEADQYAPTEFQAATDLMNQANTEIQTQNSKFALFRNYDNAKQQLDQAKAAAEKAQGATVGGKAAAKTDAETSLAEAQEAVDAAIAILARAPGGKGARAEIEAMSADVAGYENSLGEIQAQIDKEEYLDAAAKAKAVKEESDKIVRQIQDAINKI